MYSDYRRYPFFAQDADFITARYPSKGLVLVAGCGYGYLVDELATRGWDAWGCDPSPWAQSQRISARIQAVDITDRTALGTLQTLAGSRFDLIVTEEVLSAMSDAEVPAALTELRRIARPPARELFHIVTSAPELASGPRADFRRDDLGLNWKTHADWVTAVGGSEPVMDREGGKQRVLP